jgi:putative acetyltransferase
LIIDAAPPVEAVRELFEEYSRQIGVDLCVQNFEAELAGLPDNYNVILVVRDGDRPAACAALRKFSSKTEDGIAEIKRLYVREVYRGRGLGRKLTEAILQEAVSRGYKSVRLDTLPSMKTAIAMYRSMGFKQVKPEGPPDFPGQLFFRFDLSSPE